MVEQEARIKSPAKIIKATNRRADIIGYPLILSRNCPEHLNVTTRPLFLPEARSASTICLMKFVGPLVSGGLAVDVMGLPRLSDG